MGLSASTGVERSEEVGRCEVTLSGFEVRRGDVAGPGAGDRKKTDLVSPG